jgi:hypothetical protein
MATPGQRTRPPRRTTPRARMRRCGELLKTFKSPGVRTDKLQEGARPRSQKEAARRGLILGSKTGIGHDVRHASPYAVVELRAAWLIPVVLTSLLDGRDELWSVPSILNASQAPDQ